MRRSAAPLVVVPLVVPSLALALALSFVAAPALAQDPASSEWIHVERWSGSFKIVVSGDETSKTSGAAGEGVLFHKGHWSVGGPFTVERRRDVEPGDTAASWYGTTRASGSLVGEHGPAGSEIRYAYVASGSPRGTNRAAFQLSAETGTYDIGFEVEFDGWAMVDTSKLKERIDSIHWDELKELGPVLRSFMEGGLPADKTPQRFHLGPSFTDILLPQKVGPISGSREFTFDTDFGQPGPSLKGTVSWQLSPEAPGKYEVLLVPAGYDAWIPEGDIENPDKPGNDFFIEATVVKKGTKTPTGGKVNLTYTLTDVSKEPGVCTNWPDKGASKDPDLKFLAARNTEVTVTSDAAAKTPKPVDHARVVVTAFDFGAHGQLQVKATDENEAPVPVVFETRRDAPVPIPKDEDGNTIADAWDEEHGTSGQDAEWDEDDDPPGQRRNGDGFTAYEEYRGFRTKDDDSTTKGHVRTEPKKKDLFVYDPDGLVAEYFKPHDPAKLVLHFVEPPMIRFNGVARDPDNRWVNFNSREATYARQYALYVKSWTMMTDENGGSPIVGEASDKVLSDQLTGAGPNSFAQPLKCIYVVKVSQKVARKMARGHSKDSGQQQNLFDRVMESSVIHEVGHALGIHHHVPDASGGVGECAMRYTSADEDKHGQVPKQVRYCRKGETARTPGKTGGTEDQPVYTWKETPADDCFGQIDVKSDPGPCPTGK